MTVYDDESCTGYSHKGKWIKGLSSTEGVLFNNRFDLDGMGGSLLWNATHDGETLYTNPMVKVDKITAETGLDVKKDGLILTVSAQTPTIGATHSNSPYFFTFVKVFRTSDSFCGDGFAWCRFLCYLCVFNTLTTNNDHHDPSCKIHATGV